MSLPSNLKPIGHYIKIANEHTTRDPAIYYWCLFYAIQHGMEIDRKSPDCAKFLSGLLSTLEQAKKQLRDVEAVTNEMVGQAHVEEVALKIFQHADLADLSCQHDKNTVKAFYTAGHLIDVLAVFGEIDEKMVENRKYAKWKAAYIHSCLKNGQTPVPGPPGGVENEEDTANELGSDLAGLDLPSSSAAPSGQHPFAVPPPVVPPPSASLPAAVATGGGVGGAALTAEETRQAQKFCKYAISALDYDDSPTAIDNLNQALALLLSKK